MRKTALAVLIFVISVPAWAQKLNLDFPALEKKAIESVDVTLDGPLLKLGAKFLNQDPDQRDLRDMVNKLEGIYVRSYTFEKEGEYDPGVLDHVRSQLGPAWKKIVNVRGRRENSEIYISARPDGTPTGLVVLTAEPRELTIVNIVGPIDIDKLANLEDSFGISRMGKHKEKNKDKEKHHEE